MEFLKASSLKMRRSCIMPIWLMSSSLHKIICIHLKKIKKHGTTLRSKTNKCGTVILDWRHAGCITGSSRTQIERHLHLFRWEIKASNPCAWEETQENNTPSPHIKTQETKHTSFTLECFERSTHWGGKRTRPYSTSTYFHPHILFPKYHIFLVVVNNICRPGQLQCLCAASFKMNTSILLLFKIRIWR